MCVVSVLLFVMELVISHIGNSLSLASDAFAVLSHLISMIIGLFGVRASSIKQHRKSTFGFLRADVVGAFGNSIFAVALMFGILVEAVKRYIEPQKTEAPLLVLSAGVIGLLFNVLNYVIFLDCCYCAAPGPQGDAETGKRLRRRCSWVRVLAGAILGGPWGCYGERPHSFDRPLVPRTLLKVFLQRVAFSPKFLMSWVAAGHMGVFFSHRE